MIHTTKLLYRIHKNRIRRFTDSFLEVRFTDSFEKEKKQ